MTLVLRLGDPACSQAMRFLASVGYKADTVIAVGERGPDEAERRALKLPDGPLNLPILVTPAGALYGFRERAWRDFLDVGKNRA